MPTGGATSDEVEWNRLGDCCRLKAGKALSASEISPVKTEQYRYPCFGANGQRGYVQMFNHEDSHALIGRQGALCGNVCYAQGHFYATEHAVVVSHDGMFNDRFLFHLLTAANLNRYKTAGAQPGLSVARLEQVKIPVPSLSVQNKIANILDRFDALCNDLTAGLPAEIAVRQKQYEYYRDKLLSFATLS